MAIQAHIAENESELQRLMGLKDWGSKEEALFKAHFKNLFSYGIWKEAEPVAEFLKKHPLLAKELMSEIIAEIPDLLKLERGKKSWEVFITAYGDQPHIMVPFLQNILPSMTGTIDPIGKEQIKSLLKKLLPICDSDQLNDLINSDLLFHQQWDGVLQFDKNLASKKIVIDRKKICYHSMDEEQLQFIIDLVENKKWRLGDYLPALSQGDLTVKAQRKLDRIMGFPFYTQYKKDLVLGIVKNKIRTNGLPFLFIPESANTLLLECHLLGYSCQQFVVDYLQQKNKPSLKLLNYQLMHQDLSKEELVLWPRRSEFIIKRMKMFFIFINRFLTSPIKRNAWPSCVNTGQNANCRRRFISRVAGLDPLPAFFLG